MLIAAWFALGLYGGLGWGEFVQRLVRLQSLPLMFPGTIIATLPALLAWMGLWWSQFPADRALREQSMLFALEDDLPVHAPPAFAGYFASQLRLQVLFTLIPIAMILILRDLMMIVLLRTGIIARDSAAEAMLLLGCSAIVFLVSPAILKHVLRTQPLPRSPLRSKLEEMCQRCGLRYRDILLWRTDNNMGNAAVMGILPWVRYILLSDLLLETMSDEQIEAVFAHEAGHIVHKHMAWYVVLVFILMLAMTAPAEAIKTHIEAFGLPRWAASRVDLAIEAAGVAIFFAMFGLLSRRFERQADVYAARTMQGSGDKVGSDTVTASMPLTLSPSHPITLSAHSYVGEYGAAVFASALQRVAIVNNIPIGARNFSHGSIAARMKYLHDLSADPARTGQFDRTMLGIYALLIGALLTCGAAAAVVLQQGGSL
jgi:STE24 endopeptidase